MIERFQDLEVWKKADRLAIEMYRIGKDFPPEERYGIVSQMRRAAVSVPANITEGFRKRGLKDKMNFYNIAQASLDELHYYVILSRIWVLLKIIAILLPESKRSQECCQG